jgi:hypothetical protein
MKWIRRLATDHLNANDKIIDWLNLQVVREMCLKTAYEWMDGCILFIKHSQHNYDSGPGLIKKVFFKFPGQN